VIGNPFIPARLRQTFDEEEVIEEPETRWPDPAPTPYGLAGDIVKGLRLN
jgi:hypothetical protein